MSHVRRGFTQIELIFIIVIIGILASLAIPKLAATRADALLAKDVSNMAICLRDAYTKYTATGSSLIAGESRSCDSVVCYTIDYGAGGLDFSVTATPNATTYCSDIIEFGGHLEGIHQFKGSNVSI